MRVDVHTHFFPRPFLEEIGRSGAPYNMMVNELPGGGIELVMNGVPHPPLRPFYEVEEHLRRMAEASLDMHVVWQSSRPNIFWADGALGLALCQIINDEYSALMRAHPNRFIGIASVPLQDIEKAVAEAERAVREKKLKGVMTNTNVNGRYLDDPYFWPVYEALEELDVPLFIHPANPFGREKLKDYHLSFLLGLPADSALAVARLIFSGTLDRFPRLRLFVPHGGGVLPFLAGRVEHGYKVREECRKIARPPQEYFDRILVDTLVHSPKTVAFLASQMGIDNLTLGSDFPYDMADDDPVSTATRSGLSRANLEKVFWENLKAFLRLP
jgi:aminocarboxymuconate-semialdehyde decarboxylase